MRCLTLANELARQGHECHFVCREHPGNLGHLIASQGHGLTILPAPANHSPQEKDTASEDYALWLGVPWQEDARQTLDVISPLKPDWLVVDHYALDAKWECTLASVVGDIMVIDDLADRPHECTLLLDQNLGRDASHYGGLLPGKCQLLIGPRYALLRPEFAALRERSLQRRKNPKLRRVLVSLGGIDQNNLTGQVLDALKESSLSADAELDVVMGACAPNLEEVRRIAAELPFSSTVSVSVMDMADRMCHADLSIGAAGGTSWERCCLGIPSVIIVIAHNQLQGAAALRDARAAVVIENLNELKKELLRAIEEFSEVSALTSVSENASRISDGYGCRNIVQKICGF